MVLRQSTRDGRELDVPGFVPEPSATPGALRTPAPRVGEDTDAVLREMGLGNTEIARLRALGIVARLGALLRLRLLNHRPCRAGATVSAAYRTIDETLA